MAAPEDDDATYLGPGRGCSRYVPGHEVHYIQSRISLEELGVVERGRVEAIGDLVSVRVEGELRRYWNHDLARFARAIERFGPDVAIQERWSMLRVPGRIGSFCFSIRRLGAGEVRLRPGEEDCTTGPAGGFVIRVGPGASTEEVVARAVAALFGRNQTERGAE